MGISSKHPAPGRMFISALRSSIRTEVVPFAFQNLFRRAPLRVRCANRGLRFDAVRNGRAPSPEDWLLSFRTRPDTRVAIVICPSNPYMSIVIRSVHRRHPVPLCV
jgi:hypothetical protein